MLTKLIATVPVDRIIERDFVLELRGRYKRGIEHDSLIIDLERNIFYWNSVGIFGNAFDWLTKVKGLSLREALNVLQQYGGLPFTKILERIDTPYPIYPKLLDAFYLLGKKYRAYWENRGFTEETIDTFKLGYTGKAHVIPTILKDKLINFQCRIGKGKNKHIWNWAKRTPSLFNLDAQKENYVFLVEGMIDAITLHQLGIPAICSNSGLAWQQNWNKYILKFNQIYVLFDNDSAGIFGTRRAANKLLNRGYGLFWPDFMPNKFDVNECFLKYGAPLTKDLVLGAMLSQAIPASMLNRWAKAGAYRYYLEDVQKSVANHSLIKSLVSR